MLILTRPDGETIAISDNIMVTVIGLQDGAVRIGIDAPCDIAVHREEDWRRVHVRHRYRDDKASAFGRKPPLNVSSALVGRHSPCELITRDLLVDFEPDAPHRE